MFSKTLLLILTVCVFLYLCDEDVEGFNPSLISSSIKGIRGGVHNILQATREKLHGLAKPISVQFNSDLTSGSFISHPNLHWNTNQNSYQTIENTYQDYKEQEYGFNDNEQEVKQSQQQQQQYQENGNGFDFYVDNFPVILLKENEIRK